MKALELTVTLTNSYGTFFAEAEVPNPTPIGVTVVGSGHTIKGALVNLAEQLGDALPKVIEP